MYPRAESVKIIPTSHQHLPYKEYDQVDHKRCYGNCRTLELSSIPSNVPSASFISTFQSCQFRLRNTLNNSRRMRRMSRLKGHCRGHGGDDAILFTSKLQWAHPESACWAVVCTWSAYVFSSKSNRVWCKRKLWIWGSVHFAFLVLWLRRSQHGRRNVLLSRFPDWVNSEYYYT